MRFKALLWLLLPSFAYFAGPWLAHASPTARDVSVVTGVVAAKDALAAGICAVIPGTQPAAAVFGIKGAVFGLIAAGARLYDNVVDKETSQAPPQQADCGPFAVIPFPELVIQAFLNDTSTALSQITTTDWSVLAALEAGREGRVLTPEEEQQAAAAAEEMITAATDGLGIIAPLGNAIALSGTQYWAGFIQANELSADIGDLVSVLLDANGNGIPDRAEAVSEPPLVVLLALVSLAIICLPRAWMRHRA